MELIRAEIAATGPMSVARYMELCLGHPRHGYYMTRDPLGARGDFTTAPEISQMFGELIGLWLVAVWTAQGRPAPFRLVELGPGRGTLMQDALRAARLVPEFGAAVDLWLVETSPVLRAAQAARLPGARWAERLDEVPEGPLFLVANEFFDALPVRQFLATPKGLREQRIGLAGDRLAFGLAAPIPGTADGWADECPAGAAIAAAIGARLARQGGAALVIDYGYRAADRPRGPTLQALSRHGRADPLEAPGEADLTCLVDFDRLARQFAPAATFHAAQGAFLAALGLHARAARLGGAAPEAAARLAAPGQMGDLFKVLAALPPGAPPPPGVAP